MIRYRFLANRGDGVGRVSPRLDDPFEWHAFFINPTRTSTDPAYDVFISNASWNQLAQNIEFPLERRRVTGPDPPGYPRESWNATEPAIFVHDGAVFYLNGTEFLRVNMPSGPVGYDTLANTTVSTAAYSDWLHVPVTNLLPGENLLAVEVHQVHPASSDIA